jgi:hypothetical protein
MVSPGVTPAGNNSVLRTGLGGTQSATLRINRRPAYRNLSPSILQSKLIIFHSSPPRSPCPRLPPSEPLKTESLNNVRRGGLTFPPPPCSPCLRERPVWMAKDRRLLGPFYLHQIRSPAPLETRGLVNYSVTDRSLKASLP